MSTNTLWQTEFIAQETLSLRVSICRLNSSGFARFRLSSSNEPSFLLLRYNAAESGASAKAQSVEASSGMRQGFNALTSAHHLSSDSVRYSDYVIVRLLYESTRDAGFWNLHSGITDKPPNSDNIWRQWKSVRRPSVLKPTATAECDELSALYAFLIERMGVKTVGLLWPYSNHTVAVWVVRPATGPAIRIVIPTTQVFLVETDFFDTPKFNPGRQKKIYEYTRRDVADSFELPKPLFDFFLAQVDKYAGASDVTLQQLRYLRESVLRRTRTPDQVVTKALGKRGALSKPAAEDAAAFDHFIQDLRAEPPAF